MRQLVLYIHGKGGNAMEADHYKTLFAGYDVIGIDICGVFPEENSIPDFLRAERINTGSDEELYHFLRKRLRKVKKSS